MIKICFVTRKMVLGGVERTLLSLFENLEKQDVQIDLYLMEAGGELFNEIPSNIRVFTLKTVSGMKNFLHPFFLFKKVFLFYRLKGKHTFARRCYLESKFFSPVQERYDVAIAYHAPNTIPVFFVQDRVKARKKVLWLHGTMEENSGTEAICYRYHDQYDQIICVSQDVYESFVKLHPHKKDKTLLKYNIVDESIIKKHANEGERFPDHNIPILLTIGRLDRQKGLDIAVETCYLLKKRGYSFQWFICGEGAERNSLQEHIRKREIEDRMFLMGAKKNPYGYIDSCDLYIQSSRFEGYCTAIVEAKVLRKPVITTEVSGTREQISHGVTGWIVPIETEALANQIGWCLDHPDELNRVKGLLDRESAFQNHDLSYLWDDIQ